LGGLSYDDYREEKERKAGLTRKLDNKNAKLLLEYTEKEATNKCIKILHNKFNNKKYVHNNC
jgi:hypothetical protein